MRIRLSIILVAISVLILLHWNFAQAESKKIALIYDIGGRGDLSFCDASYAGAKKATDKWNLKLKEAGTDKHNQRGRTCHLPNDSARRRGQFHRRNEGLRYQRGRN